MAEQYALAEGVDKLSRSHLKHFLDSTFGGQTPSWFKVGKDNDDMSMELNPSTETTKNVWDETEIEDNGYEPTMSVDPYYARKEDAIYPKIKDIALNRLTGDECKTKMLEVLIDKTAAPFDAWIEDCIVKPQSYGGSQGGVAIPYEITPCGNRTQGTVTITDGQPVFTAASGEG
ncbi:MAG: hypothetical protein IJ555_11145 [Ruminococcus sp.]|nr:hypothetical protein [Ruminococcus sp.]